MNTLSNLLQMPVVTRFAPSPTGLFHIGSARCAIQNYLAAKASGGQFILRIDDTDVARNKDEYLDKIYSSLQFLGITFDSTFKQSDNKLLYQDAVNHLLASNMAHIDNGAVLLSDNAVSVMPDSFYDIAAGEVRISDTIRKQIKITMLQKSDGDFTYHLASVVDDLMCGVNLILRGADHLPNTPKHIALALALVHSGFSNSTIPTYGHSGLICKGNKKISKRDNDSDFSEFMNNYSTDAIFHWLLQLGWGHPDANFDKNHKTLTRTEMIELFPQGKINFKNCNMNLDKLGNLNKLYNNLKL
jgi:glutamyl/glutaminyl-tRNA synthetase